MGPVSLSAAEKAAGRDFRDTAQGALLRAFDLDPPDIAVPNFIAVYRHACPARGGRSTAIELRECYRISPAYPQHQVPAGRFGFIWRAGACRHCGATARSRAGRLVDAHERPPARATVVDLPDR